MLPRAVAETYYQLAVAQASSGQIREAETSFHSAIAVLDQRRNNLGKMEQPIGEIRSGAMAAMGAATPGGVSGHSLGEDRVVRPQGLQDDQPGGESVPGGV